MQFSEVSLRHIIVVAGMPEPNNGWSKRLGLRCSLLLHLDAQTYRDNPGLDDRITYP